MYEHADMENNKSVEKVMWTTDDTARRQQHCDALMSASRPRPSWGKSLKIVQTLGCLRKDPTTEGLGQITRNIVSSKRGLTKSQ